MSLCCFKSHWFLKGMQAQESALNLFCSASHQLHDQGQVTSPALKLFSYFKYGNNKVYLLGLLRRLNDIKFLTYKGSEKVS